MIKKKYIVAGNYEQYRLYVNNKRKDTNNSNTDYLYVNSVKDLLGLSNIEGYYIGTYYMRKDISQIQDRIAILKRIQDNDREIDQLAERINANKEADYIVEPVQQLDNNHVADYKTNRLFSG
jgi:recombinational DNA repair protein RecR